MKNKIVVIGVGYVGLVSAACLAEIGHSVICLDIDEKKIANLRNGIIPIYEPGLEDFVTRNEKEGRLFFTTSYKEAFSQAPTIAIIAVDTPTGAEGRCDISRVEAVARMLAQEIEGPITVIIKSTVPVHTNRTVHALLLNELSKKDPSKNWSAIVDMVSNPEFLREGAAIYDFMHADRIIVGVRNERSEEVMRSLYAPLQAKNDKTRLIFMDPESSEMTKYAANTMLALRITFMNWLSQIASRSHADIEMIREGIGSDKRIGPSFLQAGVGFGGSCFPKDIRALRHIAQDFGLDSSFIDVIENINSQQRTFFAHDALEYVQSTKDISSQLPHRIGIWGLAFKPNTDDMREAPSLDIIRYLLERHDSLELQLFDPVAQENARKILEKEPWFDSSRVLWCNTPLETATDVDALLLVTEWDIFTRIDKFSLKNAMRGSGLFDGRNVFHPDEMSRFGFDYFSIGRAPFIREDSPYRDSQSRQSEIGKSDDEFAFIPVPKRVKD